MPNEKMVDVRQENAVLACLLTSPELIYDVELRHMDFHNAVTRDIFCILEHIKNKCESSGATLDFSPLSVDTTAKTLGAKITAEDIKTLRDATSQDGYVDLNSFVSYVSNLKETGIRVALNVAAEEITKLANDRSKQIEDVLGKSENLVISIEDDAYHCQEPKQIEFGGDEDFEECINRPKSGGEVGLRIGFKEFDEKVGGLTPNSLTVIGARAKTGKSLVGLNAAANIYKIYGPEIPVLYIDTEMSTAQQRHRLWSIMSGVNERKILQGQLTPYQRERVEAARVEIRKMPLYHTYLPNFTPESLARLARKYRNMRGIELLIFDYIKLPEDSDLANVKEYQTLGILTNTLKNKIAGRLGIPVLTFGQLNREGVEQAQKGTADERSISASDRIIHYCSTFAIFRKAYEDEMNLKPGKDVPAWKRYGHYANRYMHIVCTRSGGDDSDPIPFYLNRNDLTIKESSEVIPENSTKPLSETVLQIREAQEK